MANRYWVGNGGSWTDTAHWSTSDGGSGGASYPTSSDNVYFTSNSFTLSSQVVTFSSISFLTMDCTGVLNSPILSNTSTSYIEVYGSLVLASGVSIGTSGGSTCGIRFHGSSNVTLSLNGATLWKKFIETHTDFSGTLSLGSNFTPSNSTAIYIYSGSFNSAGYTINNLYDLRFSTTGNIDISNSSITSSAIVVSSTPASFVTTNSTVTLNNSVAFNIYTSGLTFNNVIISPSSTGSINISDDKTINIINLTINNNVSPQTLNQTNTTGLINVTNITMRGTGSSKLTLSGRGSTKPLFNSTGGTIDCDYLILNSLCVTGSSLWNAGPNSTKSGTVTGWFFPGTTNAVFFGVAF